MLKNSYPAVLLLVLVFLASACAPNAALTPAPVNTSNPAVPAGPTPAPTQAVEQPTPPATEPAPAATGPASVANSNPGFVLFDREARVLRVFNMDGSLRYEAPSPELEFPTDATLSLVNGVVYYATSGTDKSLYRASAEGTQALGISVGKMSAFKVSPDEKWIAWSVLDFETMPSSSQLWIRPLNGDKKDAQQIANYTQGAAQAFSLMPLEWSADSSRLIFERAGVGMGGYILYDGHFSLYSYDLASGQITTHVAAEEERGMCLDAFRLDLNKVTYMCGKDSTLMSIRSLADNQEVTLPALPEQRVAGSAQFSPSGQWLAYAAARGNSEDEAGQVAVIPADLGAASSTPPAVIFKVSQQRYPQVRGWLDEDTLLVTITNFSGPRNTVLTIRRDGTDTREIGSGEFIGWMK